MERKESYVLDKEDEKVVKSFTDLGMSVSLAKTLLYISQVDECFSKDIERGADLRQPEVSVAMQEMRRRGWAKKRSQKRVGKGRPTHIYKSTADLPEIVKSLEQKKTEEFEDTKKNLSELKTMIENRQT